MSSRQRSTVRQPIRRWVGSVVLVLNEMVLVLVIDRLVRARLRAGARARKSQSIMRNGTAARVPAPRSLLSAWQFTTDRPAELLAGHRVGANRGTRVAQIRSSVNDAIQLVARDRPKFRCSIHLIPISSSVRPNAGTLLNQKASRLWMGSRFLDIHPCIGYLRTRQLLD